MKRRRFSAGGVILLIAAVLILCFIWGNSMLPGSQSYNVSMGFRNFLAVKLQGVDWIHVPKNAVMRKLAHITEFTLLGIVLTGIIKGMMKISCGWVLFAGMSAALADETIQLFSGSRSSSVRDVWIDMGGFVTGVAIVMLIMLLWRAIKRRQCTYVYIISTLRFHNNGTNDKFFIFCLYRINVYMECDIMYANQGRKDCARPAGEKRCKESYCKGGLMHRVSGHRYSGSGCFDTCSSAQRGTGTPACRTGSMSLQKRRETSGASLINCTARQELRGILCLRRLL